MWSFEPLALIRDHVIASEILQRFRPFWIQLDCVLVRPSQRMHLPPRKALYQKSWHLLNLHIKNLAGLKVLPHWSHASSLRKAEVSVFFVSHPDFQHWCQLELEKVQPVLCPLQHMALVGWTWEEETKVVAGNFACSWAFLGRHSTCWWQLSWLWAWNVSFLWIKTLWNVWAQGETDSTV